MLPLLSFWIDVVSDRYPNPHGTDAEVAAYYALIERVQGAAAKRSSEPTL